MRRIQIHPVDPQPRLIAQAITALQNDEPIIYSNEVGYAFACLPHATSAITQIRQIRQLKVTQPLTLLCKDLTMLGTFAFVSTIHFRLLKKVLPGPYTIILPASRTAPRLSHHFKSKTIGIHVPTHPIALTLLENLSEPLVTWSLRKPEDEVPLRDPEKIMAWVEHLPGCFLDCGPSIGLATTVVDMSTDRIQVLRIGAGDQFPFISV